MNGGKIVNLGIGENCSINGGSSTGNVAGRLYNSYANNCYNKSELNCIEYTYGGVFGVLNNGSKIENCYNLGTINANNSEGDIGGVVGSVLSSTVLKCHNMGNINVLNTNYVGGVCGSLRNGSIIQYCYNSGEIMEGNNYIGGICGEVMAGGSTNIAKIENCYNTGKVSGKVRVGGIIGNNQGQIISCYNIKSIEGTSFVGGIAGQNNGYNASISNSYSLEGTSANVCGQNNSIIEASEIKTEVQMKSEEFVEILNKRLNNKIWNLDTRTINNGYPILFWQ